jgi:SAM-dependent methyltransferase
VNSRDDDYDGVARPYTAAIGDELSGKPLDRALLRVVAEAGRDGVVADLGGGPGHVAAHLRDLGVRAFDVDRSPAMATIAATDFGVPALAGDLTRLPLDGASVAAAVCWYAVIHLDDDARARAYAEFARVLRPGGLVVLAFHVSDDEVAAGGAKHLDEFLGVPVQLTFRFLDPPAEEVRLRQAGLEVEARLERQAYPGVEHASLRCYLLARRPTR